MMGIKSYFDEVITYKSRPMKQYDKGYFIVQGKHKMNDLRKEKIIKEVKGLSNGTHETKSFKVMITDIYDQVAHSGKYILLLELKQGGDRRKKY